MNDREILQVKMKRMGRNSNLELLRIISMLMIVIGHFCSQSGLIQNGSESNKIIGVLIGSFPKVAVNIFLLLSVWFMTENQFDPRRVLRLWMESFFYVVGLTIVSSIVFPEKIQLSQIIKAPFQILCWNVWFISTYLVLLMISPILNIISNKLTINQMWGGLGISFLFCGIRTSFDNSASTLDALFWFIFCFFLIATIKRSGLYKSRISHLPSFYLIGIGIFILALFVTIIIIDQYVISNRIVQLFARVATNSLADIKTIPNLCVSLLIFFGFLNLRPRTNKVINSIASSTLSVYLIHQTPAFISILWSSIYLCDLFLNVGPVAFLLYIIAIVVTLFAACWCIDKMRVWIFSKFLYKSKAYRYVEKKVCAIYSYIGI